MQPVTESSVQGVFEIIDPGNVRRFSADGIDEAMKAGRLSREEGRAALDELYAEVFTERELVILKESTSNADFHYMGSAKIMARIGKAFAEAIVERMARQRQE